MVKKNNRSEIEEKHFDKMALEYDSNYGYLNDFAKYKINRKAGELSEYLIDVNAEKSGKVVVEIGCGTGEYTKLIAEKNPNVKIYASDISSGMLEVAKKKCAMCPNASFFKSSAYDLSEIKDASVDFVVGFYILHHLDEKKTFDEIRRILKPGGLVLFWEPNILNPYVYLVKSVPYLKKKAGDSPDEWAVNPIAYRFNPPQGFFSLKIVTREFYPQFVNLDFSLQKKVDNILGTIGNLPGLNYLGGSVFLCLQKK